MGENRPIRPYWTELFAEVALRALLRVHIQYLAWSTVQDWADQGDCEALRNGAGVAYADEVTVCAAISQEFLSSRLVWGHFVHGADPSHSGPRYFKVLREVPFPDDQGAASGERADMLIDRIDPRTGKHAGDGSPTYIEAKRAFRWSTKLEDGEDKPPASLLLEIKEDVEKLRNRLRGKQPRGYVLVWNVGIKGHRTWVDPSEYFRGLNDDDIKLWQVRSAALPALNAHRSPGEAFSTEGMPWLWLAMAEVTPLKRGSVGTR